MVSVSSDVRRYDAFRKRSIRPLRIAAAVSSAARSSSAVAGSLPLGRSTTRKRAGRPCSVTTSFSPSADGPPVNTTVLPSDVFQIARPLPPPSPPKTSPLPVIGRTETGPSDPPSTTSAIAWTSPTASRDASVTVVPPAYDLRTSNGRMIPESSRSGIRAFPSISMFSPSRMTVPFTDQRSRSMLPLAIVPTRNPPSLSDCMYDRGWSRTVMAMFSMRIASRACCE